MVEQGSELGSSVFLESFMGEDFKMMQCEIMSQLRFWKEYVDEFRGSAVKDAVAVIKSGIHSGLQTLIHTYKRMCG